MEEVDRPEFRGWLAEDGAEDAVDEDFGVALLVAEGRCGHSLAGWLDTWGKGRIEGFFFGGKGG